MPFHRAALKNVRQAEASMDTLVSVGVIAAYGWSLYALLATPAGDLGMEMPMSIVPNRGDTHHLYLEVASTTVALILAGRWFEARAKRRAGGALKALLEIIPTSQVLYGTDFPFRDGAEVIDGLAKHGFTGADRNAIDRDNALRLFPRLKV